MNESDKIILSLLSDVPLTPAQILRKTQELNHNYHVSTVRNSLHRLVSQNLVSAIKQENRNTAFTKKPVKHNWKYPAGSVRIAEYAMNHIGEVIPPDLYDELSGDKSISYCMQYHVAKGRIKKTTNSKGEKVYTVLEAIKDFDIARAMLIEGTRKSNKAYDDGYLPAKQQPLAKSTPIRLDKDQVIEQLVREPGNLEKMMAMVTHRNYAIENALSDLVDVYHKLGDILEQFGYIKKGE